MDKFALIQQLRDKLRSAADTASKGSAAAAEHARTGATGKEKRDDARVALEFAGLARGQKRRAQQVQAELSSLDSFLAPPGPHDTVQLGAIVEIEDEDTGHGRTFFLAPAGAGVELVMPGGDGFLSVVTPVSPVGRAALGKRLGDSLEVTVAGETRYWEITWIG